MVVVGSIISALVTTDTSETGLAVLDCLLAEMTRSTFLRAEVEMIAGQAKTDLGVEE